MAYTTTTTSITSATSSRSKQATVYQYPTGNGVVITGASDPNAIHPFMLMGA